VHCACPHHSATGNIKGHFIDEKTDDFQERVAASMKVGWVANHADCSGA
jgi:hypothetical protein